MRTIIPFPVLHVTNPDSAPRRQRAIVPFRFPALPPSVADPAPSVPEGETMSAMIEKQPRSRALHDDIVGLIHAVHGRFG